MFISITHTPLDPLLLAWTMSTWIISWQSRRHGNDMKRYRSFFLKKKTWKKYLWEWICDLKLPVVPCIIEHVAANDGLGLWEAKASKAGRFERAGPLTLLVGPQARWVGLRCSVSARLMYFVFFFNWMYLRTSMPVKSLSMLFIYVITTIVWTRILLLLIWSASASVFVFKKINI